MALRKTIAFLHVPTFGLLVRYVFTNADAKHENERIYSSFSIGCDTTRPETQKSLPPNFLAQLKETDFWMKSYDPMGEHSDLAIQCPIRASLQQAGSCIVTWYSTCDDGSTFCIARAYTQEPGAETPTVTSVTPQQILFDHEPQLPL